MVTKTIRLPLGIKCHCSKPSPALKIEAYGTLELKLFSEENIRPLRIFIHGEKPEGIAVTDIKCGKNLQLPEHVIAISGRHFTEEKSQAVQWDAIGPGQSFEVRVRSVSEEPIIFSIEVEAEVLSVIEPPVPSTRVV
jgi:hypothetical protein